MTKPGGEETTKVRLERVRRAPASLGEGFRLYWSGIRLVVRDVPGPAAAQLALLLVAVGLPLAQIWLSREILNGLVAIRGDNGTGRDLVVPAALFALTIVLPTIVSPVSQVVSSMIEDRAVPIVDREVMRGVAAMPDLTRVERPAFHDDVRLLGQLAGVLPTILWVVQFFGTALLTIGGVTLRWRRCTR